MYYVTLYVRNDYVMKRVNLDVKEGSNIKNGGSPLLYYLFIFNFHYD